MQHFSVYLDTSVISACEDDRVPEFRALTLSLLQNTKHRFAFYISEVVSAEIKATLNADKLESLTKRLGTIRHSSLRPDDIIDPLANAYVKHKVLPEKSLADGLHLAYATIHNMDYLASWNFKHLVNEKRTQAFWRFNMQQGLHVPKIVTPGFLLEI